MLRLACVLAYMCCAACGGDEVPMGTPSEDVEFPDPGLQSCFDAKEGTFEWRDFAEDIEILRCSRDQIRDLAGIEALSGLLQVEIWFNPELDNIEPLTRLMNLDTLFLNESGMENEHLDVLAGITGLVKLELLWNDLGDITALSNLTNLQDLGLDSSGVTGGITALSSLDKAQLITLAGNPELNCADIAALQRALPNAEITPEDLVPGDNCTQ